MERRLRISGTLVLKLAENRIMEPEVITCEAQFGSGTTGRESGGIGFGLEEIHGLIAGPTETESSSFTALLELPPPQAVKLLVKGDFTDEPMPPPFLPSNVALIDRASKFSVFTSADNSILSALTPLKVENAVKQEPLDSNSCPNSSSPATSNQRLKPCKRKHREIQPVKESNKKSKLVGANEASEDSGEKLPFVDVRARRGQATDSHSLAERARREKINARMKLLQELVPGCDKISGTALVLDEIINHVQALQRQVEFLSMRLAAVDPIIDFNLDGILAAESGSTIANTHLGMFAPSIWPEGQINLSRQHQYQQPWHFNSLHPPSWDRKEHPSNFPTPVNSLLSYGSPSNSAYLHSSQLKMEL